MKSEVRRQESGDRSQKSEVRRRSAFSPRRLSGQGRHRLASLPTTCHLPPTASPAFTLLELLAVFIIIAVLAGAVLGISKIAATNAATSRTRAEIATMETALESYKNDNGIYPASTAFRATGPPLYTNEKNNDALLYSALVDGPKKYMTFKPNQLQPIGSTQTNIVDPFGSPYNYFCTVPPSSTPPNYQVNQATFDLWSYGPNGLNDEGSGDDISNWRR